MQALPIETAIGQFEARLRTIVAACDAAEQWELDAATQRRYAAALATIQRPGQSEQTLERVVGYYHREHQEVALLSGVDSNSEGWNRWLTVVVRILQQRYGQHYPGGVELEDAAQHAWHAIIKALPNYRYESSLFTWIFEVISGAIGQLQRDSWAAVRRVHAQPLERLELVEPTAPDDPDVSARYQALLSQINALLMNGENPKQSERLVRIFHLHFIHDQRLADIGGAVGLSEPRVRALRAQILEQLRQDQQLRDWLDEH